MPYDLKTSVICHYLLFALGVMMESSGTNVNGGVQMKVQINRDVCPAHLAFCERCLGKFLVNPLGYERRCFELLEEDGSDILTIDLHTGSHDITLELDEEQRRMAAGEGWASFVDFNVPQYRETKKKT